MTPLEELEHYRRIVPGLMDALHYHAHSGPDAPKDWRACEWCKKYDGPWSAAPADPIALLKGWLETKGRGSQRALAADAGCSESSLSHILSGRIGPSLELASTIERLTGGAVPVTAWRTIGARHGGGAS